MNPNGMPGNRNGEKSTKFEPNRKIEAIMRKPNPPTESQQELIAHLRKCLDDAGVSNKFIVEPDSSKIAGCVINALFRLANKHDVNTERSTQPVNGKTF